MSNTPFEDIDNNDSAKPGWFSTDWLCWNKFSDMMLRTVEKKILSYLKTPFRTWYVDIGPVVGTSDKIWTISLNTNSNNTPLVMLHGLGAGVALWCLNFDSLAQKRPVYAIDLLGFGRSSRPSFSKDALEAEKQMVRAVEEWRREMNLESFILLGHSMGGFLASSYALSYPQNVKHLILADPWGFPEKPPESQRKPIPVWVKAIAYTLKPFNPLAAVRAAGPWGQWLIDKMRPDITKKFSGVIKEEGVITQYLYQCNSQNPTGESAFHTMMAGFGWAKYPMVKRIGDLDLRVPITILYGSRSWIDNSAGQIIQEKRTDSYVRVRVLPGAGHHVYADKPEAFNYSVIEACDLTDANEQLTNVHVTQSSRDGLLHLITTDDHKEDEYRTVIPNNNVADDNKTDGTKTIKETDTVPVNNNT
ncbi:protein ABHD4 [Agrilus planipennis]|uniref:1-acylglycerol-3-phosphate O-acyltransferase ABHD5 n=1 Tax=Agrilus planipennis TaxID=224129 RepID=A0A1W4X0T7_AGRPL|nr:protein ABHD4 [Agrilus planipennis]